MLDIFQSSLLNVSNLFLKEHLLIAIHVRVYCQCVIFICTHTLFFSPFFFPPLFFFSSFLFFSLYFPLFFPLFFLFFFFGVLSGFLAALQQILQESYYFSKRWICFHCGSVVFNE